MKKLFTLFLVAMMLFSVNCALAETTATDNSTIEIAPVENGTTLQFTDHNFQITLPSDWLELDVSEEDAANGIIFSCSNPDGTRTFTISYTELDAATDIDTAAADLAAAYENVQMLTINSIPFISFEIAEYDIADLATLNASGTVMYQYIFYPASDTDYSSLALQIAASIDTIEQD